MKTSVCKSYDDLPLFLNASMVSQVLGVSPSSGYELMHTPGFPVLRVGSRIGEVYSVGGAEYGGSRGNMRWRTTTIGWPRRDPRHYRFALPNAVWEYKLKPVEFVIFSCLCYHCAPDVLTPEMIATDVHMKANTVKKYLAALVTKGIVSENGTPALKCETTKFFALPNEVFLLRLPPSAFLVYAYLLLIEDRRTHICHPSYNTISAVTGISRNTVIKRIGTLLEMGLITVESSSYFDKHGMKWKGNNLYTILSISEAVDFYIQRQLRQMEAAVKRTRTA